MGLLSLQVVTPDGAIGPLRVSAVNLPGNAGRLTVLPGHAPLVCLLNAGTVRAQMEDGSTAQWEAGGGTARVERDNVVLLVRSARAANTPASQPERPSPAP